MRWQRFQTARPSDAQVAAWWWRWPDTNVGVLTGAVSHLVVLDIDPRNGGDSTIDAIEARFGPHSPTVESRTGGGGRHLWFGSDDRYPTKPVAAGCDLKGEGGVVVAPPSLHPSGHRYRWRAGQGPDEVALADPPVWLATLGSEPRPRSHDIAVVRTEQEQAEFARLWTRAGIALRPGDHNYLCPFHDDHHPSLHIDADGCRWLCFGCRRGGGVGALRHELGEPARGRPRHRILSAGADAEVTLGGDVEVDVVGESAHQDALLTLTGGVRSYGGVDALTVADLVADPGARLDAVEVRIADHPVGHLDRDDARAYHTLFAYTAREHGAIRCRARIVGGWDRGHGDVGAFGVRVLLPELVDIPPPDAR